MTNSNPAPKRRRARKPDGTYKGDNPATPYVNEAWEPTGIEEALPKKNAYEVKPKVSGTSQGTAGKYGKKAKVNPTFGKAHTTYN